MLTEIWHTPKSPVINEEAVPKQPKATSLPINQYTVNKHLKLSLRYYDLVTAYWSWFITGLDNGWSKRQPAFIWTNADVSLSTQPGIHPNEHSMSLWRPRYWPFVRGIRRSPVNSLHKGRWRGALMFSLICAWINGWVNNCEAGD